MNIVLYSYSITIVWVVCSTKMNLFIKAEIPNYIIHCRLVVMNLGRDYFVISEDVRKNKFRYGSIIYKLMKEGRTRFI